jgi:hypothetical protein
MPLQLRGTGSGGGASRFQDLSDIDWASFDNTESVVYDSAAVKLKGFRRPSEAWKLDSDASLKEDAGRPMTGTSTQWPHSPSTLHGAMRSAR